MLQINLFQYRLNGGNYTYAKRDFLSKSQSHYHSLLHLSL